MRGHVVGAFVIMGVERPILRRDAGEPGLQIASRSVGCILLNEQRCGRVTAEEGQQASLDILLVEPAGDVRRDLEQALSGSRDGNGRGALAKHPSALMARFSQFQRITWLR